MDCVHFSHDFSLHVDKEVKVLVQRVGIQTCAKLGKYNFRLFYWVAIFRNCSNCLGFFVCQTKLKSSQCSIYFGDFASAFLGITNFNSLLFASQVNKLN